LLSSKPDELRAYLTNLSSALRVEPALALQRIQRRLKPLLEEGAVRDKYTASVLKVYLQIEKDLKLAIKPRSVLDE